MDARELLAEALRLSDEERAALAGELIQSLERDVDADAEAEWSAEIRKRLARVDAGAATTLQVEDFAQSEDDKPAPRPSRVAALEAGRER